MLLAHFDGHYPIQEGCTDVAVIIMPYKVTSEYTHKLRLFPTAGAMVSYISSRRSIGELVRRLHVESLEILRGESVNANHDSAKPTVSPCSLRSS